ncbi:DUF4227 family protein [Terrilactibacillus sp. BCM23-1]|uniref:DUF4227 family protein n=1 Tax=Terrilactibacillus tamarindi TaxID=2599694 RepID=A0A6N8CMD3_9BACI|nr:DUF4227 family protein [Terrilactibacillus tamarindi]MTT31214.1 DUF4227 family protein [Terrilactibacillus tamarindi]
MKNFYSGLIETCRVFILFVVLTLFFYYALNHLDRREESYHKYDEPIGRAIKVSYTVDEEQMTKQNGFPRLMEFFRNGE